jgi:D-alanyl-D-alanine carboxypeptidase/D-alanyl-D-alanine-endopeptidase (penicillin-binding protein 4)
VTAWLAALLLAGLPADLEPVLARAGVANASVSLAVGRVDEAPALARNLDVPRVPASNQKILTAAAALWGLGADHKFETVVARGPSGELVVIGSGDPNLSGRWFGGDPNAVLLALAGDVAARLQGRPATALVLDASRFDDVFVHPDWPQDQLDRWYAAPVAALAYNDACWDVTVLPGAEPGSPARVVVAPSLLAPVVANRCVTVSERARHLVHVGRGAEAEIEVRGGILASSAGVSESVPVRDPVAFFGEAFLAALRARGVEVAGPARRGRVEGAIPLVVYSSPLDRTLAVMLTRSQNFYAECVFKALGGGTFGGGAGAVAEALRARGVPTEGLAVADGSGLARSNRATARTLYETLRRLADEPVFVEALAAGGDGTLERRFRDLGPRVRLKTGTLRGVSALSGYVTGREGGRYVLVVLANGDLRGVRALQDELVLALARAP